VPKNRVRVFPKATLLGALLFVLPDSNAASPELTRSTSAFVRSQAGSAIAWEEWNPESLERAKKQNKPVYVFIGSPLSELTRATINQTFASAKTVAWLNENFVCLLVDADTQPEVAAYAQHFVRTVKQQQGWPVHLWLTPELWPYDGANYLPPSEEWGKPGFLKAARSALEAWTGDASRARSLATEALLMMKSAPLTNDTKVETKIKLAAATATWIAAADAKNGGFGAAPKQPEPELIRFLLTREPAAREVALKAVRALAAGTAHDAADGGFFRRAIDEEWKEPYRQKTLADQARIALALFDAADTAKDDRLRELASVTLEFSIHALRNPDGSFVAALDGTGEEGATPAQPPRFVRVGIATSGIQGLLIVALQRSGDKGLMRVAAQLAEDWRARLATHDYALEHISGVPALATAVDYTALALAFRSLKDDATAERLLARAKQLYFNPATGFFMASPEKLPVGIAVRVPALGEVPSAEVLALLAGIDEKTATLLRRALFAGIEYDDQPAGDVLLALSNAH
jgi:uncharacterized protein YyaL (SSP411 family)